MSALAVWIDDRSNPVFIKEVRQLVRGKLFRGGFLGSLLLAAAFSLIALVSIDARADTSESGQTFFLFLHVLFVLVNFVLVPFMANRAMAAEREDRTFDALSISGLDPGRIIRGKWYGAMAVQLLFGSAFLPFLALAYTLEGLDLFVTTVVLALSTLGGAWLCLFSVLSACSARNRSSGGMALAGLALLLIVLAVQWLFLSSALITGTLFSALDFESFLAAAGVVVLLLLLGMFLSYAHAAAQITHPEENSGTRLRVAQFLNTLGAMGAIVTVWAFNPGSPGALCYPVTAGVVYITLINVFTFTEKEALGRRVSVEVARKRLRWARILWLPGGGRGFAFYLFQMALMLSLLLLPVAAGAGGTKSESGLYTALVVAFSCLFFAGVPSALFARFAARPGIRILTRSLVVLGYPLVMLLVLLLGVLSGSESMMRGRFWLNAARVASDLAAGLESPGDRAMFWTYGLLGLLGIVFNLPRMLEGSREVRELRLVDGVAAPPETERPSGSVPPVPEA